MITASSDFTRSCCLPSIDILLVVCLPSPCRFLLFRAYPFTSSFRCPSHYFMWKPVLYHSLYINTPSYLFHLDIIYYCVWYRHYLSNSATEILSSHNLPAAWFQKSISVTSSIFSVLNFKEPISLLYVTILHVYFIYTSLISL